MVGAVLFGMAVLAATSASLLLAAGAACEWLSPDASKNEQAAEIALIATALAVGVTSVLLVSGAAGLANVTTSFFLLGALAWITRGRRGMMRVGGCWRAGLLALRRSPILWLLPGLAVLTLGRGLALPPLAWDALTYHLTYPATWIQHGGVVRFEAGGIWEAYETFPKGGEALFYLALLPFHADYLVNLVNLPLWLGLAVAVRACAQRLGLRLWLQDGCAVVVAACPAFFAYVTPAYVEVGTAFAFAAVLSAALRALHGDLRALSTVWLGLGVGVAIKITALSWLGGAMLVCLWSARSDAIAAFRYSLLGLLAAALVCGSWFVHNAIACGNPLYPAAIPGFAQGAMAGSRLLRWTLEESSVLAQGAGSNLLGTLLAPPWRNYPLGPSALYPLALVLPWLLLPWCSRARRRSVWGLLVLAVGLLVVYLVSPWNGIYVEANSRFLGPSFIAAALASGLALDSLSERWCLTAGGALLLVTFAYLSRVATVADMSWQTPALAVALAMGACLAILAASVTASPPGARSGRALAAFCGLTAIALLPGALAWREQHRLSSYAQSYDLHPVPSASKEAWEWVARLPKSRIAFSVGNIDSTEGWFFYPLFGPDLRHDVRYVDIQADGSKRSCERRGMIRDRPDYDAWQHRLREQDIDYLLLHGGPLEARWAEDHRDRFALVASQPNSRLYRVSKPAAAWGSHPLP